MDRKDFPSSKTGIGMEFPDRERGKIMLAAENCLAMVGLTLNDLQNQGIVVDLGADEGYIARAAQLSGVKSKVISMDIKPMPDVTARGLAAYQFDAAKVTEWPAELQGKVNLIISKQGPLFKVKKAFLAEGVLRGAFKSMDPNANFRIFPARFHFIKLDLFNKNAEYAQMQARGARGIENDEFNLEANELTKQWLAEKGYKFEVGDALSSDGQKANKEFLIIRP